MARFIGFGKNDTFLYQYAKQSVQKYYLNFYIFIMVGNIL